MQFFKAALFTALVGVAAVSAAPLEKRRDGMATWYRQDGTTGSCGQTHSDSSSVVAVANSFGSSLCGKTVRITHGGKEATATVADTCPECSSNHIDLSRGAFSQLADFGTGEIDITWTIDN